jgi:predicted O-methyltransferase YrrM
MYLQVDFIIKILNNINPKIILETGTNKANFVFLAKSILPECKIYTFDINDWCGNKVDLVNEYFKSNDIIFKLGDTTQTLNDSNLKNIKFDLAFVDGGHQYHIAFSDLVSCANLNIKNIMVDDYNMIPEVKLAVNNFCRDYSYKIIDDCLQYNSRGIVLLGK